MNFMSAGYVEDICLNFAPIISFNYLFYTVKARSVWPTPFTPPWFIYLLKFEKGTKNAASYASIAVG